MTTIGLAVELPEPWSSELRDFRRGIGDLTDADIPPHVTLLGPVDISSELLDDVMSHVAGVGAEYAPFKVRLKGTGSFRPTSQVVYVTVADGADLFAGLADQVRRGPLAVDTEFPYHPHVTVAHDVVEKALDRAESELADFECEFEVDSFRIYRHDERTGWEPIGDIRLSGTS